MHSSGREPITVNISITSSIIYTHSSSFFDFRDLECVVLERQLLVLAIRGLFGYEVIKLVNNKVNLFKQMVSKPGFEVQIPLSIVKLYLSKKNYD